MNILLRERVPQIRHIFQRGDNNFISMHQFITEYDLNKNLVLECNPRSALN